jgi:hypothetical protein
MSEKKETAKGVLTALGFNPDRVAAAVAELEGQEHQPAQHDDPLLTPKQLQKKLGISATSMWRLKDLPFLAVGARRRYVWAEVQQYLAGRQGKTEG